MQTTLIQNIEHFIKTQQLFSQQNKLLLGVSGGVDSVVLLHLLVSLGYDCTIAHCNFGLRGKESEEDENFVNNLAFKYGIKIFSKRFDTQEYAKTNKLSIQVAARELRYEWFENILRSESIDYTVVAHNANDVVETFHLNLCRGTGIHGLKGINARNGNIIRPLLFASREIISQFAADENLLYREDSSNKSTKYARNKIRLKILPEFEKINPDYLNVMLRNILIMKEVDKIYTTSIEQAKIKCINETPFHTEIDILQLQNYVSPSSLLYEIAKDFGFQQQQLNDLLELMQTQPGKVCHSDKYFMLKDREKLIIYPTQIQNTYNLIKIQEKFEGIIELDSKFELIITLLNNTNEIPKSLLIANLDFDKLQFPLQLRLWQKGDKFQPLGMKGMKNVSDFLTDKKINLIEKIEIYVLISSGKIVWLVGQRIDERFKITDLTKNIFQIRLQPKI